MGELGAAWITKYMHDWIVSSDHASLGVIAVVGLYIVLLGGLFSRCIHVDICC